MKKLFFLAASIIFAFAANAQVGVETPDSSKTEKSDVLIINSGPDEDTTRIDLNNTRITIITTNKEDFYENKPSKSSSRYDLTWWDGIDLGFNGIAEFNSGSTPDPESEILNPGFVQSRYISFNFAQVKLRLIKDYVGIASGMSFQIYNYNYGGSTEFAFGDSLAAFPSGEKNITKNKFRPSYFAVPLLLEFNTSLDPRKSFHVSAGVIGKVLIGTMYKQKFELDGDNFKTSIKGNMGLNRWGLDATVRVGYRKLTFFGQMGLLPLFENTDKSPDVFTYAAGINLRFW
jgi:hypothetical protein